MKKAIILAATALLALTAAVGLSGCSGQVPTKSQIDSSVSYPDEYLITYQVEDETGVVKEVSKGIDASGNIYFKSGGSEVLFVFDNGNYAKYSRDESGVTTKEDSTLFTAQYVETATQEFTEYAEKSKMTFSGSSEANGSGEVAGRTTDSYLISVSFANFKQEYIFEKDAVTGICLQWTSSKEIGDTDVSEGQGNFVCTEFEDSDVALPITEKESH